MNKFSTIAIILIILLLNGCSFKANSAKRALDYKGVYVGTLPCADCLGIRTVIKVLPQNIYEKEAVYLGEKIDTYYSKGNFTWHPNGNIIHLDDATSYFVKKDKLIMLNQKGKIIKGDLAPLYTLWKFGVKYAIENWESRSK